MEATIANPKLAVGRQLIVRADEVDQVGTAIQSPSKQLPLSALDQGDGVAPAARRPIQANNTRPILRRDGSAPPPPSQPPPPAPPLLQDPDTSTDSLSLPQLKQLVSQFPKVEQRAYAFTYSDAQPFAEEIEEWFQYSEQDRSFILSAKDTFEQKWRSLSEARRGLADEDSSWVDGNDALRKNILLSVLPSLSHPDPLTRIESLEVIFYILAGAWATTAGLEVQDDAEKQSDDDDGDIQSNLIQIEWMHKGANLLLECSGLQRLQDCMKRVFGDGNDERYALLVLLVVYDLTSCSSGSSSADREEDGSPYETSDKHKHREQVLLLSCWYLFIESARSRAGSRTGKLMRNAMREYLISAMRTPILILSKYSWSPIFSSPVLKFSPGRDGRRFLTFH
jgi:N1221-like protein